MGGTARWCCTARWSQASYIVSNTTLLHVIHTLSGPVAKLRRTSKVIVNAGYSSWLLLRDFEILYNISKYSYTIRRIFEFL